MRPIPATVMTREEAAKRWDLFSALRLVDPGEDPRILSTNPDHFFRKPWVNASALALLALTVVSALAVHFITIKHWDSDLPWVWNATLLIVPWVVLAPLRGFWIWGQRRRARVIRGREAIAAMAHGTPAERGRVRRVSYPEGDVISRRKLDVLVVAGSPGGEAVFVDARLNTRPKVHGDLFRIGDPIWLWRGEGGWIFGQIAAHGLDPTSSPEDEPRFPSWEEMHGGHSPEHFVAGLSELAAKYRSGALKSPIQSGRSRSNSSAIRSISTSSVRCSQSKRRCR